jgi:hypothetical protein
MVMATTVPNLWIKRVISYWLAFAVGYLFPLLYFYISAGITKQSTKFVMPTLIAGIFLVSKLTSDIKQWTRTWQPSLAKGLLIALPKLILFMILISVGLVLKWLVENQIEATFFVYFETVIVLFGGQAIGAVIGAFHLKYYQLDLIAKGYVLGVVNQ